MKNLPPEIENEIEALHCRYCYRLSEKYGDKCRGDVEALKEVVSEAIGDIVQECYLECLAVECGEGEAAKAIATKFPELVSRLEDGKTNT